MAVERRPPDAAGPSPWRPVGAPSALFTRIFALVLVAITVALGLANLLQTTVPPAPVAALPLRAIVEDIRTGSGRLLLSVETPTPPAADAAQRAVAANVATVIAARLWVSPRDVAVQPAPQQRGRLIVSYEQPDGLQDLLLLGHFRIAVRQPDGLWRSYEPLEQPTFDAPERRAVLLFLLSAALTMPLAWGFARRLAIPIEQLADAAEQIGRDPAALLPVIEGPVEVERAARAVAAMQQRISSFVTERTRLLAAIAHDLRTPLTRLAFRARAIEGAAGDAIRRDIADMSAMVESSLAYARGADPNAERRAVELGALVDQVASELTVVGRAVTADIEGSAVIRADPVAIRRIVANLMENGALHGGGALVRMEAGDGWATVTISDRGASGADPGTDLEALFEPFVRGDPARGRPTPAGGPQGTGGGTGLGLSVARSLARAHGGDVTLARAAGGGLVATLRLPLATA